MLTLFYFSKSWKNQCKICYKFDKQQAVCLELAACQDTIDRRPSHGSVHVQVFRKQLLILNNPVHLYRQISCADNSYTADSK